MKLQTLPIAAFLLRIASAYTGDMTYYETGTSSPFPFHLQNPPNPYTRCSPGLGSCGYTNSDSDAVVALSVQMMATPANPNNNPKCGTTITITNPATGGSHTATIVDTCQGCAYEDIDVSPSVFEAVDPNGLGDGRITVNWSGSAVGS